MKKQQILGFLLLFVLTGFFGFESSTEIGNSESFSPPEKSFIDSLVTNAPLREKIGQLFFIPVEGKHINQDSRRFKEISNLITKKHIGGIIFTKGDIFGQAILTNKLQRSSQIPLWIAQDIEFGAALKVTGTTLFTPAMGVAATGDKSNAFMMGKITAIEAKALGVHQIFTHFSDADNNPDNPVFDVHTFSGDPQMASSYAAAFKEGVRSEGLFSTARYYPGHGNRDIDSKNEFSIPGEPLRDSLNFEGIVVIDGLKMERISSKFSPGRLAKQALDAGAGTMLTTSDIYSAINEIVAAVERGEISEERIDESFRKIIQWKEEHGLFEKSNQINIEQLDTHINTSFHQSVASEIARESITVLKNEGNILPVNPTVHKKILLVSFSDSDYENAGERFALSIRNYHPNVTSKIHDIRSNTDDEKNILHHAQNADLIIIGLDTRLNSPEVNQLSQKQSAFLRKLIQTKKPTISVTFGAPHLSTELDDTDAHVIAWANTPLQIQNTGPALFGASEVSGKLPVQIPGMYDIGDGIDIEHTALRYGKPEEVGLVSNKLYTIEDILRDAVRDSVFPGAVAAVVKDGVMVYRQEVGYHDYEKLKRVKNSDVYDLASITKVVSTTTAVMKLVDENKLSLDDEVRRFIPEFETEEKEHITIRDMLLHQSGLPPFRVYVDSLKDRAGIIQAIKNEPLIYETGAEYRYSDLGMILLAEIISSIVDQEIDQYMKKEFYSPMGMYDTHFNPRKAGHEYVRRVPPTEVDTVYKRGIVQGDVHDERAYYLDGVAGHAGLFATVDDLAKFSTMLLNGGTYAGRQYLSPEIIDEFTTRQSELSGRGLGFDRKRPEGFTTAGQLASNDTFGHLGFTGTSLWIDRERNMTVILLTNRTYPNRSYGRRISRIRAAVADAAFSAFIYDQ